MATLSEDAATDGTGNSPGLSTQRPSLAALAFPPLDPPSRIDHSAFRGNYWVNIPPPDIIHGTEEGRNFCIFRQMKQNGITLSTPAPTPPGPGERRPVELIDLLPQQAQHDVHSRLYEHTENKQRTGWCIMIAGSSNLLPMQAKAIDKGRRRRGNRIMFLDPLWLVLSKQDMESIRQAIHHICERLPIAPGTYDTNTVDFIRISATRRVPAAPKIWDLPIGCWRYSGKHLGYVTTPAVLDATKLKSGIPKCIHHTFCSIRTDVNRMNEIHTIPCIPSYFAMQTPPLTISEEECGLTAAMQIKAWRVNTWATSMLHGRVLEVGQTAQYTNALLSVIGMKRSGRARARDFDSLYSDGSLYNVERRSSCFKLKPSVSLRDQVLAGTLPAITVPLRTDSLMRVIDVMESAWLREADVVLSWEAACVRADHEEEVLQENGEGSFDEPVCACQPSDRTSFSHLCDVCGSRTLCSALDRVEGRLVCPNCMPSEQEPGLETVQGSTGPNASTPQIPKPRGVLNKAPPQKPKPRDVLNRVLRTFRTACNAKQGRAIDHNDTTTMESEDNDTAVLEAWAQFREKFGITSTNWTDVYSTQVKSFDNDTALEERHPFGLSIDMLHPIIQGPSNLVPTSCFLNRLKHFYSPIILPLVSRLCNAPSTADTERLQRKIDHLYLIRLQFPFSLRAARLELSLADPFVQSAVTQANTGEAYEDKCLQIDKPWQIESFRHRFSENIARKLIYLEFPSLQKVQKIVAEIEEARPGFKFNRIDGTVYLFSWHNRPSVWKWSDNRAFYSKMLHNTINHCNREYITTCEVDTLFLIHCMQVANPPAGMEWLRLCLEPYVRHPFRASGGHAAHGLNMTTGFPPDYGSLEDYNDTECNIDIEPWVWNIMRGSLDHYYDAMIEALRALPEHNEPYWTADAGSTKPVPRTSWGGCKVDETNACEPSESASRSTGTAHDRSSSHRHFLPPTTPTGPPHRVNLTNDQNICYASALFQAFYNTPRIRDLITSFTCSTRVEALASGGNFEAVQCITVVNKLKTLWHSLDSQSVSQLPPNVTLDALKSLQKINHHIQIGREDDPSVLCSVLIDLFNKLGDLSSDKEWACKTVHLTRLQESRHRNAGQAPSLSSDCESYSEAHLADGHDSDIARLLTLKVAYESQCLGQQNTKTPCPSPYTRNYLFEWTTTLAFPVQHPSYSAARPYTVPELLEEWANVPNVARCEAFKDGVRCQGIKEKGRKKIFGAPQILVLRIERLGIEATMDLQQRRSGATAGEDEIDFESLAGFRSNPLVLEEHLDIRKWCETTLPSESELGPLPTEEVRTLYRLTAIVQYANRHYYAYALCPDEHGTERWALFDDTKQGVVWKIPFQQPGHSGQSGEFILIYSKVRQAACDSAAASLIGPNMRPEASPTLHDVAVDQPVAYIRSMLPTMADDDLVALRALVDAVLEDRLAQRPRTPPHTTPAEGRVAPSTGTQPRTGDRRRQGHLQDSDSPTRVGHGDSNKRNKS